MSIDGTGTFTFDRTKFLAAFDADPQGVTKLFAQSGSSDNANVQFVSAGDRAVGGHVPRRRDPGRGAGERDVGLTGCVPARVAADREGPRRHAPRCRTR